MLGAAAVGNVAARRAGMRGPAAEAAVALGSAAVAVEVFAWSERHEGTVDVDARCAGPATRSSAWWAPASPPTEQLEVGRAALAEILRVEADPA